MQKMLIKQHGLSANDYMETVTGFSASLLQSLGGDTAKAADSANMAITDMADNANKMGTSMDSIQYTYQGFAKQNYTMLDNLKLGYGGTQSEMERLLADAQKITGVKYDITNLNDVYNAIHVIQGQLGITGTTAKEASNTISGSFSSMKSAFTNFLTALGTGNKEDLQRSLDELGQTAKTFAENLVPVIANIFIGILDMLNEKFGPALYIIAGAIAGVLVPALLLMAADAILAIAPLLPFIAIGAAIGAVVYGIVQAVQHWGDIIGWFNSLWQSFVSFLSTTLESIGQFFVNIWNSIGQFFVDTWNNIINFFTITVPQKISEGVEATITFFEKIPYYIGYMIGYIIGLFIAFFQNLWNFVTVDIPNFINAVINWFAQLPGKIATFMVNLWQKIKDFGANLLNFITVDIPNFINGIINWFAQLPGRIWNWLVNAFNNFSNWITNLKSKASTGIYDLINSIINWFKELPGNMLDIGKNIVEGLWNGIKNAGNWIKDKVKEFANSILDGMKNALGIHSPSTEFRDKVGKYIALGVGEGFTRNIKSVYSDMQKAVTLETGKLSSNLTSSATTKIIKDDNTQATLNAIGNTEITLNNNMNLDGEKVYENQQKVSRSKNLQYGFGGAN